MSIGKYEEYYPVKIKKCDVLYALKENGKYDRMSVFSVIAEKTLDFLP